jgi:hypothetical protein
MSHLHTSPKQISPARAQTCFRLDCLKAQSSFGRSEDEVTNTSPEHPQKHLQILSRNCQFFQLNTGEKTSTIRGRKDGTPWT